ncbi:RHS repeat domain-containing protein [Chitinophaga tropicalis]|uniref:YD repeat-containing protein n=1 Tax=Chitinophaga tropicalis TaxID=2683588 RepID=A0A7K1U459_9BACT|nr:RHS repeat domain-containing protein [Chitinophaga tropicalis]MVT09142.1 hypothetical protein [Chitinophaga tropicalis]
MPSSTFPARDQSLLDFLTALGDDPNRANYDAEPDVFSFNFGKYSGKFILDENRSPVLLSYSALKVERDIGAENVLNWKITDPEGIQYYFGGDSARDQSHKTTFGTGCGKSFPSGSVTAWYLAKIIHPNNDTVYFDYSRVGMTYTTGISQTMYAKSDFQDVCNGSMVACGTIPNTTCLVALTSNMALLKEIRSTGGARLKFTYINRKDVADRLLSKIEFFSAGVSTALKTFELSYSYSFNSSYLNSYNGDSSYRYRPFLSQLAEYGNSIADQKVYGFSYLNLNNVAPRLSFAQDHYGYFNGQNNTTFIPKPSFPSMQDRFPSATANREINPAYAANGMLSKIIYPTGGSDSIIYGSNMVYKTYEVTPAPIVYSIGGTGNLNFSMVKRSSPDMPVAITQEVRIQGWCSFNPDAGYEYDDRHHLSSVTVVDVTNSATVYSITLRPGESFNKVLDFVTGNTYRVDVVSNGLPVTSYADFSYIPGNKTYRQGNLDAGGMRVEKVITKDHLSGTNKVKKYLYGTETDQGISSGGTIFEPSYDQYMDLQQPCSGSIPGCEFSHCYYYSLFSSSINNIYTYAQSPVSYSYVTESEGENFENGGTNHTYVIAPDIPGNSVLGNYIPSAPFTGYSWKNGLETITHTFRIEGGQTKSVQKVFNHYKEDTRINQEIRGYVVNKRREQTCFHTPVESSDFEAFDLLAYSYFPKWIYVDSTRTLTYTSDGQQYQEDVAVFTYGNKDHAELTATTKLKSAGDLESVESYYPQDVTYTGTEETARQALVSKHIIAPVMEQSVKVGGTQTYHMWTSYQVFPNGLVLPQSQKLQIAANPVEMGYIFYSYDNKGKLLEQSKSNDVHEVYLWGYNSRYPVAKVVGASYSAVISLVNQGVLDNPSDDQTLRTELQKIRTGLPSAQVITYTYKDLVGPTSTTDPAGRTIFYEYDNMGRLNVVRDQNGKILKVNDYRYQYPFSVN